MLNFIDKHKWWFCILASVVALFYVLIFTLIWYPSLHKGVYNSVADTPFVEEHRAEAEMGKLNLNTATLHELSALPNVGQVRAQAILDYRRQNGVFNSAEDLLNIKGIGEKTLEEIAAYVYVS